MRKIIFVVDNANSFTSRAGSSRVKQTFPPEGFFQCMAHWRTNISNAVQFSFRPGDNFLFLFFLLLIYLVATTYQNDFSH